MHSNSAGLHAVIPDEKRNSQIECQRLVLETGADFSLPYNFNGGHCISGFEEALTQLSEATLENVLNLGGPFVSPNTEVFDQSGNAQSALSLLARMCGYVSPISIHIVDKAIFLLKRKADIACRDSHGDTILHTLLSCYREHIPAFARSFFLGLTEPRQLLTVFLSAGADVYAVNQKGETPSSVAKQYGPEDEWIEALTACGYNHEEILAHLELGSFGHSEKRQSPQLSFEDVCRQRQEYLMFKEQFFEERCRFCREKFDPLMVSFDEECGQCGEKFRYKGESLDNQYQPLREQYLRDKDIWTQYRQRRKQSLDDKCLRFKKAYFEERCRDCGCQFQPELEYSPERCLQCGARIRPRRGPMEACFKKCLIEYLIDKHRYKWAHGQRDKNFYEDDTTDWDEDSHLDYDSVFDYDSDTDRNIASNKAKDIQINHSHFTTDNPEIAHPNLAEGPRTKQNQMNFQAMDLDDIDVNTNLEARENGWIASPTEAARDNRVVDAVVADVASEEHLFQTPFIPANDEALSFHSQIPADLNHFEDFFDLDRYFGDA